MGGQVIHDHDVALLQLGDEEVFEEGEEDRAIGSTLDPHCGFDSVLPHGGQDTDIGAVVDRGVASDSLPALASGIASGHRRVAAELIQEDEAAGAEPADQFDESSPL